MNPIQRSEILPLQDYEELRPRFRGRIVEEKQKRRCQIGPHIYGVFENRDSVMLQIQEMLRTERITAEAAIMHEIETYNDLLPFESELSFTMFVAIADKPERDRVLVELAGLEQAVFLVVDGIAIQGRHQDRDGAVPERTTAVHYFKFDLTAEAQSRVAAGTASLAVEVRHPNYTHRAELDAAAREALSNDWV